MNGFGSIKVKGFRRLFDIDLQLRPLTVLIGANGSGKTSLLEVFDLLAASAHGEMNSKITELGGVTGFLTIDRAQQVSFELAKEVPNHNPLEYELVIRPSGNSYVIAEELLCQRRGPGPVPFKHIESRFSDIHYFDSEAGKLRRPTWDHSSLETSLSQVPKMYREPEEFRNRLASSTFYHVLNVEPNAPVRLPQQMRPALLPGRHGEDLVTCLYNLRETNHDRFDAIQDGIRAGFPTFDRLDFPPVAAGTLAMTWRDKDFSRPIYTHQMSEGMLRFLWLLTLLQSPGLSTVTLIDEPEVSLHPELLSLLAQFMREATQRTQLVVATHSDRLVRFLKPGEVVAVDIAEDGAAAVNWADSLDIEQWLDEYTLDEVWRIGRMGGRS